MAFRVRKVEPYNFHYSERSGKPVIVVLHHTAGSFDSAKYVGTHNFPAGSNVSWHYLISKKGGVWQFVDENKAAWHAGHSRWDGRDYCNDFSVGIEIENRGDGKDPYPDIQVKAVAWIVGKICRRWDIPHTREYITDHKTVNAAFRKAHPDHPTAIKVDLQPNFPWEKFMNYVKHPETINKIILPVPEKKPSWWTTMLTWLRLRKKQRHGK